MIVADARQCWSAAESRACTLQVDDFGERDRRATGGNHPPRVLDRFLIFGRRHLEQVLAEYVAHYNEHRPHRGLDQQAPGTLGLVPDPIDEPDLMQSRRNEILGGLIHEYCLVA